MNLPSYCLLELLDELRPDLETLTRHSGLRSLESSRYFMLCQNHSFRNEYKTFFNITKKYDKIQFILSCVFVILIERDVILIYFFNFQWLYFCT